jgi:hypothetical protein
MTPTPRRSPGRGGRSEEGGLGLGTFPGGADSGAEPIGVRPWQGKEGWQG